MAKVYVINLPKSVRRRERMAEKMSEKQIDFAFFNAVDGNQSFPLLAKDYDYKKALWLTSGKLPLNGEIGCYASHYSLWLKCIELNHPIVVCEDDIELSEDAKEILDVALNEVRNYGFLRLQAVEEGGEYSTVAFSGKFTVNLMKDNYGGLLAYAITPDAAARLIKHRWCLPVDCFIGANYIHGQYSYQLTPCFVDGHGEHESTIQDKKTRKTAFYRKLTRELYSGYKKVMLELMYKRKLREYDAYKKSDA